MDKGLIEQIIRDLITKTPHLSLATVCKDKPWVCEVHFAYDDQLNLYFVSKPSTRHCLEIEGNRNVAGNIIKQHPLTEAPNGLYFEGVVEEVQASDEDIRRYTISLERDFEQIKSQLSDKNGKKMYKIAISNWAVFGDIDGNGYAKHELKWSHR